MPSQRVHVPAGIFVGGVAAAVAARELPAHEFWWEVLGGAIAGGFAGAAPDILEPAIHSHHRGVAHSMAAGTSVVAAAAAGAQAQCRAAAAHYRTIASNPQTPDVERRQADVLAALLHAFAGMIPGLAGGYVSHLALDATTPRGIPLIARGF